MESTKVSKIHRSYGKTVNLVNYFGFVPYTWCEFNQKVTYQPFKAKWIAFLGVAAALHQTFMVTQSIRGVQKRRSIPLITLTRTFYVTLGYIVCNQNFYAIFKDPPFRAAFVNGMILTAKRFYGGHVVVRRGNERGLLAIIWTLGYVAFQILPALLTLPMLWKPEVPLFYTSILEDPEDCWRFAIFLIQAYISAISFGMLVYNGVTVAVCLFFITDMLRLNTRGTTGKTMRFKVKLTKLNAELTILVNCLNQIFREWTSRVELLFAVVVIVNFTEAVLMGEIRMFLTSIMVFIVLFYLISLA